MIQQSTVTATLNEIRIFGKSEEDALATAITDSAELHGVGTEVVRGLLDIGQDAFREYEAGLIDLATTEALPIELMNQRERALYELQQRSGQKKKAGGKGNGREREQMIFEASLIGLNETEEELRKIGRQLEENRRIAGANAEAQVAAYKIAADAIQQATQESMKGIEELNQKSAEAILSIAQMVGPSTAEVMGGLATMGEFMSQQFSIIASSSYDMLTVTEEEFIARQNEIIAASLETMPAITESLQSAFSEQFGSFVSEIDTQSQFMIGTINGIQSSTARMAEAINQSSSTAGAAWGALAAGATGFAATFIKNQKTVAKIWGLFEVAESVRSFASLDFLGGAQHALAAAKYFIVAGSGAAPATSASASTASRQQSQASSPTITAKKSAEPQAINQYFFSAFDRRPSGQIVADALNETARANTGVVLDSRVVGTYQGGL
jgi:hypothetical protein